MVDPTTHHPPTTPLHPALATESISLQMRPPRPARPLRLLRPPRPQHSLLSLRPRTRRVPRRNLRRRLRRLRWERPTRRERRSRGFSAGTRQCFRAGIRRLGDGKSRRSARGGVRQAYTRVQAEGAAGPHLAHVSYLLRSCITTPRSPTWNPAPVARAWRTPAPPSEQAAPRGAPLATPICPSSARCVPL